MFRTFSFSTLVTGLCILAAAAAAPLIAQTADGPGVTVDLGGAALMHRPRVEYPAAAQAGRIEGLVVVQAAVDSVGNVTDARVISGPDELRKTVIQSVLQWHFARGGSSARSVSIAFRLPVENSQPAPAAARPPVIVSQQMLLPAPAAQPSPAAAEFAAIQAQQSGLMTQARDASSRQDQQAMTEIMNQMRELAARRTALQRIRTITATGLSDQARSELLASLPIHEGDAPTPENMARLSAVVKQFDEHLSISSMATPSSEEVNVQIIVPGAEPAPRIQVGGMVQEANLTNKVMPDYPALAKQARIQGVVIMNVTIGKDGSVQEIKLVSGHPILAPAAMEAVKQWTYKPTLLNGQPVEVTTQATVNFTLQDQPPVAPPQQ